VSLLLASAGSVMYEYGGRLGRELAGKNGLQKQVTIQ